MIEAKDTPGRSSGKASAPSRRLCIVTRRELPPEDLIRFALSPDAAIVPDLARKLPGRGVWVTATRDMVDRAATGGAFSKSLKQKINAPKDLGELVAHLLLRRAREALSIANKAGAVITGFAKVDAALGGSFVIALVHARDAAEDGRIKLGRKFTAIAEARGRVPCIIGTLDGTELDLAMGRPNVVHAALTESGAARNFLSEARRYQRYSLNQESGHDAADAPRDVASTGTE